MPDPNELARQMAARQRNEKAERKAHAAAQKIESQERLVAEIRDMAVSVMATLEARGYPGMQPIVLLKSKAFLRGVKRQDVAAWHVARCDWKGHRGDRVVTYVWLLADGSFGAGTGTSAKVVDKVSLDTLPLSACLSDVLKGLVALAEELNAI